LRLIRKFEERYGFLQGPQRVEDYNVDSGITFLQGQYNNTFITKFALHTNGVLAEANASTEEIDGFLDDVLSWGTMELGSGAFQETTLRRAYLSQLEIELDIALGRAFSEFMELGKYITNTVQGYGQNTYQFEVSSLSLHCDLLSLEPPKPAVPFIFARREGKGYGDGIYFASAPLRTPDHLNVLEQFQTLLASRIVDLD
jgi:hypothetical protein